MVFLTNVSSQSIQIFHNLSKSYLSPWIPIGLFQEFVGRKRIGDTGHGLFWHTVLRQGVPSLGQVRLGFFSSFPKLLNDGTVKLADKLERIRMIASIHILGSKAGGTEESSRRRFSYGTSTQISRGDGYGRSFYPVHHSVGS